MQHASRKATSPHLSPASLILIAAAMMGWAPWSVAATGPADVDAWPSWVDEQEALQQRIARVNEGDLDFIPGPSQGVVHHHRSRIFISDTSLLDGWVRLEQCHVNLDRVAAVSHHQIYGAHLESHWIGAERGVGRLQPAAGELVPILDLRLQPPPGLLRQQHRAALAHVLAQGPDALHAHDHQAQRRLGHVQGQRRAGG